ncbi:MAG TPA: hypothetical protein PKY59_04010 [Pyrinomonadaceae bacterium]|nr:hypothetical protein [Pyrinomonadaceae bacterium]
MKKIFISILMAAILIIVYLTIFGILESYKLVDKLDKSIAGIPFYPSLYLLKPLFDEFKINMNPNVSAIIKLIIYFIVVNVFIYSIPIYVILKFVPRFIKFKEKPTSEPPPPPMF